MANELSWVTEYDCRECPLLLSGVDCSEHPDFAELKCRYAIERFTGGNHVHTKKQNTA